MIRLEVNMDRSIWRSVVGAIDQLTDAIEAMGSAQVMMEKSDLYSRTTRVLLDMEAARDSAIALLADIGRGDK